MSGLGRIVRPQFGLVLVGIREEAGEAPWITLHPLVAVPVSAGAAFQFLLFNWARYRCGMTEANKVRCPTCQTEYLVVRVEVPPTHEGGELLCLSCGGPLRSREGKFALKYFRDGAKKEIKRNGRKPKL